jgi:cell division protein FtsX
MAKPKEPINPFYVLSAVAGVAFTITACAYLILMWRSNEGKSLASDEGGVHPLMNLLDKHGLVILIVQVLLIGAVAIAAIVLDHFRGKRMAKEQERQKGRKGEGETS